MNYLIIVFIFFVFSSTTIAAKEINTAIKVEYLSHNEPILPIPEISISKPELVKLGKKLFLDTRLSSNDMISCASCHPLANAGVDHLPIALGINGFKGTRNTPTVYNSSLSFRQFWDGRVKTLEEQVLKPIVNPLEMGANMSTVLAKLAEDAEYQQQFSSLFPDAISAENVAIAIAEFERSLLTPNSPFDLYLKGNKTAINQATKEGYQLFKSYGCASCHQGVAVGGNMYEKVGVIEKYYTADRKDNDLGRFKQTGVDEHKHEFKVPSLRNVALTAPYFHNGSVNTLEKAIIFMGKYQLGRRIPKQDVNKIVLFLESLTGL